MKMEIIVWIVTDSDMYHKDKIYIFQHWWKVLFLKVKRQVQWWRKPEVSMSFTVWWYLPFLERGRSMTVSFDLLIGCSDCAPVKVITNYKYSFYRKYLKINLWNHEMNNGREGRRKHSYTVLYTFSWEFPLSLLICCEILDKLISLGHRQLLKMKHCEKVKRGNGTANQPKSSEAPLRSRVETDPAV